MQYVASHTTIPVPRVYAVHTEPNDFIYIEMAYVRGEDLESVWGDLSADQMNSIFADLKRHMSSLRGLQPPAQGVVSSALGFPPYDCRIGNRFFGPMAHDEFHSLVRGTASLEDIAFILSEEVATIHTRRYQTHFAHADLCPRNIIVRGGRIAANLDWAFAGWYPEYWDLTKAHYNLFHGQGRWEEYLRLVMPCYEMELRAERVLGDRMVEPGSAINWYRDGVRGKSGGSAPAAAWLQATAGRKPVDLWTLALCCVESVTLSIDMI
ncbi:chitinase 18-4 [Purpureocillium lavendulum]|uniref:Chitinase 18-4 n=1 Tax=Purpureocillium lavendulum TaxID=1247861 RepID=A0AB34FUZ4_9HYPO|nr:chitinase 18-4 [Purpureocillium lavendulum]